MRAAIILGTAISGAAAGRVQIIPSLNQVSQLADTFGTNEGPQVQAQTTKAQPKDKTEPCLTVANTLKTTSKIPADIALACLKSVPLDKDGGLTQVAGLKQFLQFQSTTAYLKTPPPGWLYPSTDILAGIDSIAANLNDDKYTNEYDFQFDIYKLAASAYDGHFSYISDIVSVFGWTIPVSLLSVSTDGTSLPDVYVAKELAANYHDSSKPVSAISTVNGIDVEQYLNQIASTYGSSQDPDTNYNYVFLSIPQTTAGPFGGTFIPFTEGANVTRADGTFTYYAPTASTRKDFSGVTDGASFFQKFCVKQQQQQDPGDAPQKEPQDPEQFVPYDSWTTEKSPTFYPAAVVIASDQSIAGYFPTNNNDTAVLAIQSFEPSDPIEFQNIVRRFLATAQAQDKTKLVIDLRGNPGGIVLLAYDLLIQLFPNMTPYGGTNFRATDLFNDIGSITSAYFENVTDATATPDDFNHGDFLSIWNYKDDINVAGQQYGSWADAYGPVQAHGDEFTNIIRWDLDNVYEIGFNITNHGGEAGYDTQTVFDAANIVLLQDGFCASTCTVFSEFAKAQGGIKQIAFGGRKQTGPMQGVGAVKGANVYSFASIGNAVADAFDNLATQEQHDDFVAKYPNWETNAVAAIQRAVASTVNVRNQIRQNDDQYTPLQFVYEAADYRRFYTTDQIFDQSLVWGAAVDVAFNGAASVDGSTGQASSAVLTGDDEQIAAPDGAKWNSAYPDLTSIAPTDF